MEKRNVKITKKQAEQMLKSDSEAIRGIALETYPELYTEALPKKWDDQEEVDGYFINEYNHIVDYHSEYPNNDNKHTLPNIYLAEVQQVQPELLTMRNIYRNGWKPEHGEMFYAIDYNLNIHKWQIFKMQMKDLNRVFTFPSEKVAKLFIKNFYDQLELWRKIYQ